MEHLGKPELFDISGILASLVGAAAAAAVLAGAQLPPRLAASLVAVAVRGAVQGTAALTAQQPTELLGSLQAAVHPLGATTAPQAVHALRSSGQPELAKRMQRLSKARNGVAHPDITFLDDLRQHTQMGASIVGDSLETGLSYSVQRDTRRPRKEALPVAEEGAKLPPAGGSPEEQST